VFIISNSVMAIRNHPVRLEATRRPLIKYANHMTPEIMKSASAEE
jgi:hypothetical protein